MQKRIVLLAKRDTWSRNAALVAEAVFANQQLSIFHGIGGDPLPHIDGKPDCLISFLSPWIVPQSLLDRCGTAVNFHPGSTDYPGTGCYNFALYDEAEQFGAVCHHMLAKVDTGRLIAERRFPVFAQDTVETVKLRTMVTMLSMFHDIACLIASGERLPEPAIHWTRKPYRRVEMEALKELRPDMPLGEVRRRVRATIYPGYSGPYLVSDSGIEHYPVPQRGAIA